MINNGYHTCAGCSKDVADCKIYSNIIGKLFSLIFNSDRPACIRYIKRNGEQAFAEEMAGHKRMTMKRK